MCVEDLSAHGLGAASQSRDGIPYAAPYFIRDDAPNHGVTRLDKSLQIRWIFNH